MKFFYVHSSIEKLIKWTNLFEELTAFFAFKVKALGLN